MKLVLILIIVEQLLHLVLARANLTEWEHHRRQKRTLIYPNSNIIKLVAGLSYPIRLYDRVPFRQLRILYNFQAQYDLPQTAAALRSSWFSRKLKQTKFDFDATKLYKDDPLRTIIYTMLEVQWNQHGQNGRECLKRAICENGQDAENVGVVAEIVHEVLRPSKYNSDKEYLDAFAAGESGAECLTAFPDCKKGDSFLDKLIFVKEF